MAIPILGKPGLSKKFSLVMTGTMAVVLPICLLSSSRRKATLNYKELVPRPICRDSR